MKTLITATAASLVLFSGEHRLQAQTTAIWTNSVSGNWSVASNWQNHVVPPVGSIVYITNGVPMVTLDTTPQIAALFVGTNGGCGSPTNAAGFTGTILSLNGNTMDLYGPVTVGTCGAIYVQNGILYGLTNNVVLNGEIELDGGELEGTITLASNSILNITSNLLNATAFNSSIDDCTFTNYGTVIWSSDLIESGNASVIYNYGLWDAQCDQTMNNAYGGEAIFNNWGTFRKSAGATNGATIFTGGVVFSNTGVVDIEAGNFSLQGNGTFTGGTATNTAGFLKLADGNFFINGTMTSTNVQFTGGNLVGTNVIAGGLTWISGTWDGSTAEPTVVTIAAGSLLNIMGGTGGNDLSDCVISNYGTVAWSSGLIETGNTDGTIIYNYGLWNAECDQTMNDAFGQLGGIFNNIGTFRKSVGSANGATTNVSGVVFNNTGVVDIQAGNFLLEGGGTFTSGTATNTAGFIDLAGGNFTINGTTTTTNVQLDGGNLIGTNVINGGFSWISGLWSGSTAEPTVVTVAANALLNIMGGTGNNDMANCVFSNYGTIAWSSGVIRTGNTDGTVFYNYGLWNAECDQTMNAAFGQLDGIFNNIGTFRKSVGSPGGATTNTSGVVFNNTGIVDIQAGNFLLQGGGTFTGGTATNNAGHVELAAGNYIVNGTVTSTNVQLLGGDLTGTNVINGGFSWISGVWSGSTAEPTVVTIASNALLNIMGAAGENDLPNCIVTNYGTVVWSSGTLRTGNTDGTIFYNYGLWDAESDQTMNSAFGQLGGIFNNLGTFRKSAGATNSATTFASGVVFNNTALVDAEQGYLALAGGGGFTNCAVTGAGAVQLTGNTFTLSGNVTQSGAGQVQLAGGILSGTAGFMLGNWAWSSGYFAPSGTLTLFSNSLLTVAGSGDMDIYGALTNAGAIQIASGILRVRADQGYGRLTTLPGALLDVQSNTLLDQYSGGTFYNEGTLRKSSGGNTTTFNPAFFNSGAVDVESGVLSFANGGTFSPGTVFVGPSNAVLATGTFTVTGSVSFSNVVFNTVLTGADGVLGGSLTWGTSGSLAPSSTLTVAANGLLTLAGSGDLDLFGALTNAGAIDVVSGTFRPRADQGPGTLINLPGGLVDVKSDVLIDQYAGGKILNEGTFRKSGGTGTTTINPQFTNSGTLDAEAALMSLAGTYSLSNGTLNFGLSGLTNFGTINLAGAAALTGTVSATLNNGYVPIGGNTFNVLSFGSKTGSFTNATLPAADAWSTNYTVTNFFLQVLNARPTLNSVSNQTVHELTTLTVTNTATDPDQPPQTLIFSLVSAPAGITINSSTGVITWTPAQTNSPSTNTVTVAVTDNGIPPLSATNSFMVTVVEVNVAPTLPVIAGQTVDVLALLTVTNTASETNIHSSTTGYGLVSPPAGVSITTNGIITWTPTQAEGPNTNTITTVVTNFNPYDLVNPHLVSSNSFQVIVYAPTLAAIGNFTNNAGQTVSFAALAHDNDATRTLTFSLGTAPAGAAINSASGLFNWRSPASFAGTTNIVQVEVTANSTPSDTVAQSFDIVVNPLSSSVTLKALSKTATQFEAQVTGPIGPDYVLEGTKSLYPTNWSNLLTNTPSASPFTVTTTNITPTNEYYRIKLSP